MRHFFDKLVSRIGEKHANTHGPITNAKTAAFHLARIIVFYSK